MTLSCNFYGISQIIFSIVMLTGTLICVACVFINSDTLYIPGLIMMITGIVGFSISRFHQYYNRSSYSNLHQISVV